MSKESSINNSPAFKSKIDFSRSILNVISLTIRDPIRFKKAYKIVINEGPKGFFDKLEKKKFVVNHDSKKKPTAIAQYFHLGKAAIKDPGKLTKAIKILFSKGPKEFYALLNAKRKSFLKSIDINQQYQLWFKTNYPAAAELKRQTGKSKDFEFRPTISVLVPTYNTKEKYLRECIQSVMDQSYLNWELCLVDDASSQGSVRDTILDYAKKDQRIKYLFKDVNGHISEASNSALEIATGDYVALLDHDDVLWPNALFEIVSTLQNFPKAEFIYSDEDKLSPNGSTHEDPFFKPDWSPDYLRSINYITHLAVLKKELANRIGGFRLGYEGAQDWDLFLRATNEIEKSGEVKSKIIHIANILYSWRKSPTSTASGKSWVKSYAYKNQKKVLEDDLVNRGLSGEVLSTGMTGIWRVKYDIVGNPLVSIVIPTKEKYSFISKCLNSILEKTTYQNYEIIVVDSGSTEQRVWDLYEKIKDLHTDTKVFDWKEPFNFSSVCNFGVEKSRGQYIVLLNNDTEIITPNWIESMLEHAQRKEIGAVGCKLLYPNKKIQHAGVILGIKGGVIDKGVAGHAFKMYENSDQGENFQAIHSIKNYTAVTAACLMLSRDKYELVKGLDPTFRIAFNDIDFCLKIYSQQLYNLYTPFTVLYHHESVTVGTPEQGNRDMNEFRKEIELMHARWGDLLQNDPFYNKNLTLDREDFSLRIDGEKKY